MGFVWLKFRLKFWAYRNNIKFASIFIKFRYWVYDNKLLTYIIAIFLAQKAETGLQLMLELAIFFLTPIQLFANTTWFFNFCTQCVVLLCLNFVPFAVFLWWLVSKALKSLKGLVEVFTEVTDVSKNVSAVFSLTSATDNPSNLVNLLNLSLVFLNLVSVNNFVDSFKKMIYFGLFCYRWQRCGALFRWK